MYCLEKEYFHTSLSEYHRADAMRYAQYWHGGQFTELYKLSSSGYVDSPEALLIEVEDCYKVADFNEQDTEEQLDCLKGYAIKLIKQEETKTIKDALR